MRLALFGNVGNVLYQLGKAIRERSDIDVHLFIDSQSPLHMLPESDELTFARGYPSWIHRGQYVSALSHVAPWTSPIIDRLREFDLLVVSGLGPTFAQFVGRPWCFLVTGGDLTMNPFPLRFWRHWPTVRGRLGNLVDGFWQRRAISTATEIWSQPFSPFERALSRLGVRPSSVAPLYFPYVLDVDRFRPDRITPHAAEAARLRRDFDFILFHPSRLLIGDTPALRDAGQWKRNDLLIRAYARFVRSGIARRPALVMLDRSTLVPDTPIAQGLVKDLGIESAVVWLRPPRPIGFSRDELIAFYKVADVVSDDFGAGWFGLIVLEAMALERPVVTYVDQRTMARLYPWHPMVTTNTEDGIVAALAELYRDPRKRAELGRRGRAWVAEFHSAETAGRHYVEYVESLASRLGISGRR